MKKTVKMTIIGIVSFFSIAACAQYGNSPASENANPNGHSALSQSEKRQPCYECHKEVTPDIYEEWYNSRHGIAHVRCFQCHGGYDDLKVVPDVAQCSVCHMEVMDRCPKDRPCWSCHSAHEFKGKK